MKSIFKVVAQQEPYQVTKQDQSTLNKCTIVLQEIGGKYEDSYVCSLLGNGALCKFYPNDIVYASLRFQHSEYQGKFYNEITVQDIVSFSNH